MSAAIKSSRMAFQGDAYSAYPRAMPGTGFMGDPGIFGIIGSAFSGVTKFVKGGVSALAGKQQQRLGTKTTKGGRRYTLDPTAILPGGRPFISRQRMNARGLQAGGGVARAGGRARLERLLPGGRTGRTEHYTREEGPPGPGYHLNKSGYFLKDGTYIEPQSVWVRNRRRNPGNMRALDRAVGRIESGKRMAARLGRITIRKACK